MTIKKNKLALLVGLLCAGSAAAQDVYTFDEVVVSATRSEQSISDVAVSVDVVDSKNIEENLAQDLEQAVANEPGVSMPGTGRFGNSGFNIRGLGENYVKTMVDGVEQPVSFDPGADVMRKYNNNVETDTLQRIEINKGPSSSLYGSDALAGAVIIRTKNPEDLLAPEGDDTYASVKTGYYSADESYKATATIANRTGDLDTLLIFTHRDGHETQTHSSGADIEGRERGQADPFDINSDNLLLKAFYQINDDHRIGLTGEIFNREADGLISSNEGYEIMPGFVYTRNSANDEDKRKRVTFEHDWQANTTAFDRLKWQVTALESESLHNTFDETPEPPTSFGHGYRQRVRNGEDKSTQFDAQFDKAFELATSYHEISYGVNYITNEFTLDYRDMYLEGSKAGTHVDKAGDVPNAESVKWGIFVQDQAFLLEERLVLNAGLRYDSFKAEPKGTSDYANSESDAVTAKLGAVYHWTERLSSYANVSQGFKSPTLQDLYYFYETDAAYGAVYEANPDLKPEESVGYETGLRITQDFGRFDFAVYYNDYKNFIESTKLADNNGEGKELWSKQNISKAEIYGAELKAQLALDVLLNAPTGTYSDFSVAYTKGKDKENGEALDTVSPLSAYFALGYANVEGTYGGKVAVKAVAGKSDSDWSNANIDTDNVSAPGYAVTDITAYYRPVTDLTVRAGLFNAFDKKYWEYTNLIGAESDTEGLDRRTQSGRNWGIEAEYVF